MAIDKIPAPRGGENYEINIGFDEDGNCEMFIDQETRDTETNLPLRNYPDEIRIKFNKGKGRLKFIYTAFEQGVVGPSGELVENRYILSDMLSREEDEQAFMVKYGAGIMRSVINGWFIMKGFPHLVPFDPVTGAVIQYTPEQLAAPNPATIPVPVVEEETPSPDEPAPSTPGV